MTRRRSGKRSARASEPPDPEPQRERGRAESPAPSPHSHDGLFKRTFGVREHALDLIRHQLPAELVAALDPGSLQEEPEHYIDDAIAETRSDVLYSATLRGSRVLVYVLIEHQSTQDPLMAYRLLRYVVRIWERWLRDATSDAGGVAPRTLPPVIPFVLHQGPRPWTVARSLLELIPLPAALAPFVRPLLPSLDMSVLDLGEAEPAALVEWDTAPIVRFTLAIMRGVVDPGVDVLGVMTHFQADLAAILGRPDGREAFAVVMRYIVRRRSGLDVAALASHTAKLAGREAGEVVMSTAQELIDQGVRETLRRQLGMKFGPLTPEVGQRLDRASPADLARWTERILSAERIEDVFTRAKASRPRGKRRS